MCEGVLLQDLLRPHRHAGMMECARRRSGCRLPWTWVSLRRACTSRSSPLMRAALAHLQDYLSWCVERGRNRCVGCYQTRGEDAQMLTCGGCRVARFCSADHQKMASKSVASGGNLFGGKHKDVCGVLGKWRQQVVKDGMSPDVLRADLLAFLRQ